MSNPRTTPGSAALLKPNPWYLKYPVPKTTAQPITREELRRLIESNTEKQAYVLVDLRRTDHEGGTIHTSINLPAQSLYSSLPALYKLFSDAKLKQVIWYCESSKGRGTRAAGWFADYLKDRGDEEMQSLVLLEGIRGWACAGEEYINLMDEYEAEPWQG